MNLYYVLFFISTFFSTLLSMEHTIIEMTSLEKRVEYAQNLLDYTNKKLNIKDNNASSRRFLKKLKLMHQKGRLTQFNIVLSKEKNKKQERSVARRILIQLRIDAMQEEIQETTLALEQAEQSLEKQKDLLGVINKKNRVDKILLTTLGITSTIFAMFITHMFS